MLRNLRVLSSIAFVAMTFTACSDESTPIDEAADSAMTPSLEQDFADAARTHQVPADLLKAIAYAETRWQMVAGEEEHVGRPAGHGLFALWGDNLALGAAAAGIDEETARTDVSANIDAAAARIAQLAADHGVGGDDLLAWSPVIGAFVQSDDPEVRDAYTSDVLDVLAAGATETEEDGTVIAVIEPHPELGLAPAGLPRAGTADYPASVWRPSGNYNSRNGSGVDLVVIHTCEGGYAGCWGWLRNAAAGASAHYVVKENGAEITQLVREASRAWHVAADYQCSRAGGKQCNKNGVSVNNFAVGIEHAGFASQKSFASGMIEASAKLTCNIAKDHAVPRDRNHIVSHGQLQPWSRTDPGPNWPWAHYIDRVRAYCGDGGGGTTPTGTIIVDSNNANNNAAKAKLSLAGTWKASAATKGYYGSGYYYAATAATSAPATFWFYLPSAQTRTIDAWWTAGANRSGAAPFVAYRANGSEAGRRVVSQKTNGSKWVTLGTWSFSAGWNKVVLSRWTSGDVVVADAVRVR